MSWYLRLFRTREMTSNIFNLLIFFGFVFHVTCASSCGDGTIDPWEVCDDGNTFWMDGCAGDCSSVEDGYSCNHLYDDPSKRSVCCKTTDGELHENPHRNSHEANFCGPCKPMLHESNLYYVTENCERIDVNECANAQRCPSYNYLCLNIDTANLNDISSADAGYECKCIYGGIWSLACDGFRYVVSGRYAVGLEMDNITTTIKNELETFFRSHIQTVTGGDGQFKISIHTDTSFRRLLSLTNTLVSVVVDFARYAHADGLPAHLSEASLVDFLMSLPNISNVVVVDSLGFDVQSIDEFSDLENTIRNPDIAFNTEINLVELDAVSNDEWSLVFQSPQPIGLFFISKSTLWDSHTDEATFSHPCIGDQSLCCLVDSLQYFEYGHQASVFIKQLRNTESQECQTIPEVYQSLQENSKDYYSGFKQAVEAPGDAIQTDEPTQSYGLYGLSIPQSKLLSNFSRDTGSGSVTTSEFIVGRVFFDTDGISRVATFRLHTESIESGLVSLDSTVQRSFTRVTRTSLHKYTSTTQEHIFISLEIETNSHMLLHSIPVGGLKYRTDNSTWQATQCIENGPNALTDAIRESQCMSELFEESTVCAPLPVGHGMYQILIPLDSTQPSNEILEIYFLIGANVNGSSQIIMDRQFLRIPYSPDYIQNECSTTSVVRDVGAYVNIDILLGVADTQETFDSLSRLHSKLSVYNTTLHTSAISVVGGIASLILNADDSFYTTGFDIRYVSFVAVYFLSTETYNTFNGKVSETTVFLDNHKAVIIDQTLQDVCNDNGCVMRHLVTDGVILNDDVLHKWGSESEDSTWLSALLGSGDYVQELSTSFVTLLRGAYPSNNRVTGGYFLSPLFPQNAGSSVLSKHMLIFASVDVVQKNK